MDERQSAEARAIAQQLWRESRMAQERYAIIALPGGLLYRRELVESRRVVDIATLKALCEALGVETL